MSSCVINSGEAVRELSLSEVTAGFISLFISAFWLLFLDSVCSGCAIKQPNVTCIQRTTRCACMYIQLTLRGYTFPSTTMVRKLQVLVSRRLQPGQRHMISKMKRRVLSSGVGLPLVRIILRRLTTQCQPISSSPDPHDLRAIYCYLPLPILPRSLPFHQFIFLKP
jgi:hypothetical protein